MNRVAGVLGCLINVTHSERSAVQVKSFSIHLLQSLMCLRAPVLFFTVIYIFLLLAFSLYHFFFSSVSRTNFVQRAAIALCQRALFICVSAHCSGLFLWLSESGVFSCCSLLSALHSLHIYLVALFYCSTTLRQRRYLKVLGNSQTGIWLSCCDL